MSLQVIAIIIGAIAIAGGLAGMIRPRIIQHGVEAFPRSVAPAWLLTAICCFMGAKYALEMNMGFLDAYKKYIYFITPGVFIASVVYMKELLAPRAFGGFLLLIAVPILQIARWHESAWRLVVVVMVYAWIVYGLVLLLSPWYFRKWAAPIIENNQLFRLMACSKTAFGLLLLLLGFLVY